MLVASVAGAQPALHAASRAAPAPKPNIIFILTDDLSWNLVPHLPHIRGMRQRGLTFTNYVVTNSLCCPSRATILSGKYPHNSRVLGNTPPDGGFEAFRGKGAERMTYATALRNNGYRTAFMGKYMNGYRPVRQADGRIYVPPGWTEWHAMGEAAYHHYNYNIAVPGRPTEFHGTDPADYATDVLAGKSVDFIRRASRSSQPFMLSISTFAPHDVPGAKTPQARHVPAPRHRGALPGLNAPTAPSWNEPDVSDKPRWIRSKPLLSQQAKNEISHYYLKRVRMMLAVDDLVNRVQRTLAATGEARDTYVGFTSDNGFHLGEHRLPYGKMTVYEPDINVPLIVTGPGVPAGATVTKVAMNADLTPTFEELAGAPHRPFVRDGRSLVPFLRGRPAAEWRNAVLIERYVPTPVSQADPDRAEGAAVTDHPAFFAVRGEHELYAELADGDREYYNLAQDPWENHNGYDQLSNERKAQLRQVLQALRTCAGPSCRTADVIAAPPPPGESSPPNAAPSPDGSTAPSALPAAPGSGGGKLPRSGDSLFRVIGVALGLVAVGVGLLMVARRRRVSRVR